MVRMALGSLHTVKLEKSNWAVSWVVVAHRKGSTKSITSGSKFSIGTQRCAEDLPYKILPPGHRIDYSRIIH